MAAILPLAVQHVGAGILAVVTTEPQPVPKPTKPRLLQDGRDMFWSHRAAGRGLHRARRHPRDVLVRTQRAQVPGPAPDYDAPAALQADADALRIPIRLPVLPDGWKSNSGSRAGIEGGRTDPSGPAGARRVLDRRLPDARPGCISP